MAKIIFGYLIDIMITVCKPWFSNNTFRQSSSLSSIIGLKHLFVVISIINHKLNYSYES